MKEFKYLEKFSPVEPCAETQAQLELCGSFRGFSLSRLRGEKGKCVWCHGPLKGRQMRWCSDNCTISAQMRCYPQWHSAKMNRLIFIQDCACAGCGESYEDRIGEMIKDAYERINKRRKSSENVYLVSLHLLGYGTGDIWHTDHIKPIYQGGKGIDPNNLQVLCVPCHKKKTSQERR